MGSRPRMSAPGQGSRSDQTITLKGVWYVLQLMSALGQKQTSEHVQSMSALPPKADIRQGNRDVCFVPKADSCAAANSRRRDYSVTALIEVH